MRIVNLIENTEGSRGCACAHGLSFYVETGRHKLLVDLGPSEKTLENAGKLGVDLAQVDIAVLSHGHYDHSGGIMAFSRIAPDAAIYLQESAGDDHYADDGEDAGDERYRYNGIDKAIMDLPQVRKIRGDHRIDDELELFTVKERTHELPFANKRLLVRENGGYVRDDFRHEQYLVIADGDNRILMSGCAHNGILSILDAYKEKYDSCPDAVISGFHLMKKDRYTDDEHREIEDIAKELKKYPTMFYTCHCTGDSAYQIMKTVMGDQLQYVHSGDEVMIHKWPRKSETSGSPLEERRKRAEESIQKRFHKKLFSPFAKACKTYGLIEDGDHIAVCISGGKDSMLMAKLFQEIKRHRQKEFDLTFLVMDPGYKRENRELIESNAEALGIPITIFESTIFDTVEIMENPCYLCARMRRGYLYSNAKKLGCNKIALGHHYDDVIETILMGMLHGGQIQTMMPKLHSTNFEGMELIRPMYLVREADICAWRDYNELRFLQCACHFTDTCATCGKEDITPSKRLETKKLIEQLKKTNPFVEYNIFKSVENVNLDTVIEYKKDGVRHNFMDDY